jgi:uncharacterized protein
LLLHVPMKLLDRRENPGPHALYVARSQAEFLAQLRGGLDRYSGFVGINNHMGSKFTADARGMSVVLAELRRRGLIFLDSKPRRRALGFAKRPPMGCRTPRNVFLDDNPTPAAIGRQLALVERVARHNGSAISAMGTIRRSRR